MRVCGRALYSATYHFPTEELKEALWHTQTLCLQHNKISTELNKVLDVSKFIEIQKMAKTGWKQDKKNLYMLHCFYKTKKLKVLRKGKCAYQTKMSTSSRSVLKACCLVHCKKTFWMWLFWCTDSRNDEKNGKKRATSERNSGFFTEFDFAWVIVTLSGNGLLDARYVSAGFCGLNRYINTVS